MGKKIDRRSKIRLVNEHILSYVMAMIAIKSYNQNELENLCLLQSKISEINTLFQVTERAYRKLIDSLFVNDKFLKEIDECLAYNYPITTQDCVLSLTCEEESSSSPETNKCTASTSNFKDKKVLCHRQNR